MQVKKRVQLDFGADAMARLDRLKVATESASYAEVIRNALRLYEGLIEEAGQNGRVLVPKPDGTTAIVRIFS